GRSAARPKSTSARPGPWATRRRPAIGATLTWIEALVLAAWMDKLPDGIVGDFREALDDARHWMALRLYNDATRDRFVRRMNELDAELDELKRTGRNQARLIEYHAARAKLEAMKETPK